MLNTLRFFSALRLDLGLFQQNLFNRCEALGKMLKQRSEKIYNASGICMIEPRKLKGFKDFGPEEMQGRNAIIDALRRHAQAAGFVEIATPALEYADVLLGSSGAEADKEVYRFQDHGQRDIAMRFDLTVPFARYVVEHQGTLSLPFRKLQVGQVWRGEKPQKGRYREFCQADLDIVGVDSPWADIEVLTCLARTLVDVVPTRFTISIGQRAVLSKLIQTTFVVIGPDAEQGVLVAIDKLAKVGEAKFLDLVEKLALSRDDAKKLLRLIQPSASGGSDLQALAALWPKDDPIQAEIRRLQETMAALQSLSPDDKCQWRLDLCIARGLGYYTGLVFETTIDDLAGFGSISSGGRYNKLLSRFSKNDLAGIGGSIGVDRLLAALEELAPAPNSDARRGVFIAIADEQGMLAGFELAKTLREHGAKVEAALRVSKLAQQFRYADKLAYRYVVVLGSDELAAKSFTCKDLTTGQEAKNLSEADLRRFISAQPVN